jgi:GDP-4-dehydro-6-deoxy-D-mannose reductase
LADARQRVAVFGAGGFSGRHFEQFVAREGLADRFELFGHTRDSMNTAQTGTFTYREGDPCIAGEAARFLSEVGPDYIFNLVGIFHAENLDDFLKVHVGISRSICEAIVANRLNVRKVLLVGSAAEYGSSVPNPVREDAFPDPINFYGLSKLFQTLLARYYFQNYGLPVVVARTFNILGEGLSECLSIGSFIRQIREAPDGGAIKVGNITTSRDFLDIAEVSRRYWSLLMKGEPGEVYNICSGHPRTIQSVLEELICRSGKQVAIEVDPARLKHHDVQCIYGDSAKFCQLAA